jgi:hypothetical protein
MLSDPGAWLVGSDHCRVKREVAANGGTFLISGGDASGEGSKHEAKSENVTRQERLDLTRRRCRFRQCGATSWVYGADLPLSLTDCWLGVGHRFADWGFRA